MHRERGAAGDDERPDQTADDRHEGRRDQRVLHRG